MKKISILLLLFLLIGSSIALPSVYAYTPVFQQVLPNPTTYPANDPSGFYQMTYSGSGNVTAGVQAVDLIMPPTGGSTSGCEAADFAGFIPGNIALIQRGTCTFFQKAANAQAAGAIGVIIFNEGNTPDRTAAIQGTLGGPGITIPVVGASFAIGEELYNLSLSGNVIVHMMVESASVWQADKSADVSELTLSTGETFLVNYTVTVDVIFVGAVDNCTEVTDTLAGSLGTVCIQDAPKTFTYSRNIGPYDACGEYTVDNIISFVPSDTGSGGVGDAWTINVHVPCIGCTLTQGYWKTHSKYGPTTPYDPTWDLKAGGDAKFFSDTWDTGYTWYSIMWVQPKKTNAYIILAQQYIAAWLSINNANPLKKADPTALGTAMADAEALMSTYAPSYNFKKDPDGVRDQFIDLSNLLAEFNAGYIGPGHCDPCIDITKYIWSGIDAGVPPGPFLPVGGVLETVDWKYVITNCGNIPLTDVLVTDDQGIAVTCPKDNLAVGESITCTASDSVQAGQNANTGTAMGTAWNSTVVQDSDISYYFGVNANEVIGETTAAITRNRRYESSMGDFVTDIMRANTGVDFAFYNSGSLRADIDAGPIAFGEAFSVLPFSNTIVIVELDGNEVRQVLEEGITGLWGLIQVSGLQFTFSYDNPVGSRIIGDVIDLSTGLPLVPSATYHVAVNNFMASGGEGYFTLAANPQINTGIFDVNIVVDWIRANSPFTAPDPAVQHRITALGTPPL